MKKLILLIFVLVLAYQVTAMNLCDFEGQTFTKNQFLNANLSQFNFIDKNSGVLKEYDDYVLVRFKYCNGVRQGTQVLVNSKNDTIIVNKASFEKCLEITNDQVMCENNFKKEFSKARLNYDSRIRNDLLKVQVKLRETSWSWFRNWVFAW